MAAKRPARRQPARGKAPVRRRTTKTATRRKHPARRVKIPRGGPLAARLGTWLVLRVVVPMVDTRRDDLRSRKDAAIERLSHDGCKTCGGKGQTTIRGKNGEFKGSESCKAAPTKQKVSRWAVQKEARFGAGKRANLVGWTCPCGKKERPRYRDAKLATKALRAHEKAKHGGKSVNGGLNFQAAAGAAPSTAAPAPKAPVTKSNTGAPMGDADWIKQNKPPSAARATRDGLCRFCTNGAQYGVHMGQQITGVCSICHGSGKSTAKVGTP